MVKKRKDSFHQNGIEDVFSSYEEYRKYIFDVYDDLSDDDGAITAMSFSRIVPTTLRVEFDASIKAPRYMMPRFDKTIVYLAPDRNYSSSEKGKIRQEKLDKHISVLKLNELNFVDQLAIRRKILESSRKGQTKGKATSAEVVEKMSVIVADDDPDIREIIIDGLPDNLEIIEASDGVEIQELLQGHDIAVVISDVNMPKVDGIALYEWSQEQSIETRFVFVTGNIENKRILENKGCEVVMKPFHEVNWNKLLDRE